SPSCSWETSNFPSCPWSGRTRCLYGGVNCNAAYDGSSSAAHSSQLPAIAAAIPASPSPAPRSATTFPATSSGRCIRVAAKAMAEGQARVQYGSESSRPG
ncbi:hypothetical protein Vafri_16160, partial [Volvox africanus]